MPYADPDAQRKYQNQWLVERRTEWLSGKCCARCGSTKDLQIDHIDPSKKLNHKVWSWEGGRREAELTKCQVLCTDCHRTKSAEDRKARVEHGSYTMRYTYGCCCEECTEYVRRQKRESRNRLA